MKGLGPAFVIAKAGLNFTADRSQPRHRVWVFRGNIEMRDMAGFLPMRQGRKTRAFWRERINPEPQ